MRNLPAKKEILGVNLALLDYKGAIRCIEELAQSDRPAAVSFCNTHLVAEAAHNERFCEALSSFDLNLPDGMPLVWALNKKGAGLQDRVYGPYLMRTVLEHRETSRPFRHFLLGGTVATLNALEARLTSQGDSRSIVGIFSPPFRPLTADDNLQIADKIKAVNPDCVWVAMGGVKQECWIAENLHHYTRGVFLGVGDAFSLLSGQTEFAPAWMQRSGLTWMYRLLKDPKRLASRYFRYNSLFLYYWLTREGALSK